MATIYLIVGFMGFGKTTLAKRLEKQLPAIRLTSDEFMRKLFSRNLPDSEFRIAWRKIDDLIWDLTAQIIHAGTDVVLDYGFWSKDSRREAFEKAMKITENIVFYQVGCDIQTAKQRVLKRTENNQNELFINEDCFNKFLQQYQPIEEDEGLRVIHYDC